MTAVELQPVEVGDAGELLTLQRAAYVSEARLYRDVDLPPLTQTLAELTADLAAGIAVKAVDGHRIVGAVRGRIENDTIHIGRLTVAPDRQGEGIGSLLLAAIEAESGAATAALFTGALSIGNLRLYARHGYHETHRTRLTADTELVHPTKPLN